MLPLTSSRMTVKLIHNSRAFFKHELVNIKELKKFLFNRLSVKVYFKSSLRKHGVVLCQNTIIDMIIYRVTNVYNSIGMVTRI